MFVPEFGQRIPPNILTAVQNYLPNHNHLSIGKDEVIDHLCAAGDCLWETLLAVLADEDLGTLESRMIPLSEEDVSLMREQVFRRVGGEIEVDLYKISNQSGEHQDWCFFYEATSKLRIWALIPNFPDQELCLVLVEDISNYRDEDFPYNVGLVTGEELRLGLGIDPVEFKKPCVKMGL